MISSLKNVEIKMAKEYLYTTSLDAQSAPGMLLRQIPPYSEVLEVGCASGVQTRILSRDLHCKVTGIELNSEAAAAAAEFCERIITGSFETLDLDVLLAGKRFDIVTFADVLEHLYDPEAALRKAIPLLKPEGYVLASIPNIVHMAIILDMAHGLFDYREYGLLDDTHIRFFTLKNIHGTFEKAGLKIVDVQRAEAAIENAFLGIHPISDEDKAFVEYIKRNNAEWWTFQFVVKALPLTVGSNYQHFVDRERIKRDEERIRQLEEDVRRTESKLSWLESRPIYRLGSYVKRFLRAPFKK
jgi:2-polyprenyl-3-methyl-5-hydroxy-6-metoxy-1,4-benzoquinol methylase